MRFFGGLLGRPDLTWSEHHAKRSLGHYDAAHNTIVVSRVFDRPSSPRYAIEYLLYHEMLHLKHPVRRAACAAASTPASSKPKKRASRNWPKPSPSSSASSLLPTWLLAIGHWLLPVFLHPEPPVSAEKQIEGLAGPFVPFGNTHGVFGV